MKTRLSLLLAITIFIAAGNTLYAQNKESSSDHLVVLWASGDRDVAVKSCLMYAHAARKYEWFSNVTLIIWGPSARLVVDDDEIRSKVLAMKADGVVLEACLACSNMLDVTAELKALGIEVKGMGAPLTEYLKSGAHVLTY
jgi:hypothetical protein